MIGCSVAGARYKWLSRSGIFREQKYQQIPRLLQKLSPARAGSTLVEVMIVIGAIPLLAEVAVPNGFRPRWIWSTALAHKTEDLSPSFEKNCSFERRR